jgi:hypothetical protein
MFASDSPKDKEVTAWRSDALLKRAEPIKQPEDGKAVRLVWVGDVIGEIVRVLRRSGFQLQRANGLMDQRRHGMSK